MFSLFLHVMAVVPLTFHNVSMFLLLAAISNTFDQDGTLQDKHNSLPSDTFVAYCCFVVCVVLNPDLHSYQSCAICPFDLCHTLSQILW